MKEYVQSTVVFAVMMMIIPCVVFLGSENTKPKQDQDQISPLTNSKQISAEKIKILFTKENAVKEYSQEDYVLGAVLAQMPADFEPAALQAQAVLARTYAAHRIKSEKESPTSDLKGCIMSDDNTKYQAFFTDDQAKEFYKENYQTARSKVLQAVKLTQNKILTYNSEPILIAFHAASNGYTASSADAWGQDIPYLKSVQSKSDEELSFSNAQIKLTSEQLKQKLLEKYKDIKFNDKPENWLKTTKTNDHGYVMQIQVCGNDLTGAQISDALGLNSPAFTVEISDDTFTFKTKGIGHLVGMSQFGANDMAKNGKSCEEILTHYFKDCKLCEIS